MVRKQLSNINEMMWGQVSQKKLIICNWNILLFVIFSSCNTHSYMFVCHLERWLVIGLTCELLSLMDSKGSEGQSFFLGNTCLILVPSCKFSKTVCPQLMLFAIFLSHYEYVPITATDEGFCMFKILFDGYLTNGKNEKFYGKYYAEVPLKSTIFFEGLSRNAATLLVTKVGDSMLAHCKRLKSYPDNGVPLHKTILLEKEKAGLLYLE